MSPAGAYLAEVEIERSGNQKRNHGFSSSKLLLYFHFNCVRQRRRHRSATANHSPAFGASFARSPEQVRAKFEREKQMSLLWAKAEAGAGAAPDIITSDYLTHTGYRANNYPTRSPPSILCRAHQRPACQSARRRGRQTNCRALATPSARIAPTGEP